jgi:hypothetical protein
MEGISFFIVFSSVVGLIYAFYQLRLVQRINMHEEARLGKASPHHADRGGSIENEDEESRLISSDTTTIPLDDDRGDVDLLKLTHISDLIAIGANAFLYAEYRVMVRKQYNIPWSTGSGQ